MPRSPARRSFYDSFIFGTATALVFGNVFFAELGGGRRCSRRSTPHPGGAACTACSRSSAPASPSCSAATFLLVFKVTADPTKSSDFQTWGWRIPFLASIVLVGVGLYVRLRIEETPIFRDVLDRATPVRVPVREALAVQWRQMLLAGGSLTALSGFFYIGTVFVTGYAGRNPKGVPPGTLGFAAPTILTVTIVATAAFTGLCRCRPGAASSRTRRWPRGRPRSRGWPARCTCG